MTKPSNLKPAESVADFRQRLAAMLREKPTSIAGAAPAHPCVVRQSKRAAAGRTARRQARNKTLDRSTHTVVEGK